MTVEHGKYYKIKIEGKVDPVVGRYAKDHGAFFYAREKFKATYNDLVFLKDRLPSPQMKCVEEILEEVTPNKCEIVSGEKIWENK